MSAQLIFFAVDVVGIFSVLLFALRVLVTSAKRRNARLLAVVVSGVVGFIGGLFPAIRAARLPIATALRAV